MNHQLEQNITAPSLFKFALPSMVMMVVMSLYTVVDGTFVSRLIGTDAFSAVNLIYPLISFTIGLGTMFGTGITALVSIKLGEGKREEANRNFTFIIAFTALLGFLLSLLSILFLEKIIHLLGANQEIYAYCYDYAFPLTFFFSANILQFQFQNMYVANGKPHIGLILTLVGGITNLVLDYVFIAKLHLGISGAALATGIGYSIPAIFGLAFFALKRTEKIHFVRPQFQWRVLLHTMANGSSEMVNYLSTSVTTFLFNLIMMRLAGQNGVAAIAILLYLDFILIAVSMGYSIGVAPLFSSSYGRGDATNLRKLYRLSLRFCLAVGLVMTTVTILFAKPLTRIFTEPGTDVFSLAATGLTIYAFGYLFKGFNIFASAMFTAFGNGPVSAALSLLRTLVFLTGALIVLSRLFGIFGVWFATPIAEFLAFLLAVVAVIRYRDRYHYGNEKRAART